MPTGWTTIGVPKSLHAELKRLAEERGVAMWELLNDMLSFYKLKMRKGMGSKGARVEVDLQKIAYYIMKISYSIAKFKDNPSSENYEWLKKTAEQISDRLGVSVDMLLRAADVYRRARDEQSTYTLNMAWKQIIMELMSLVCS